MREGWGAERPMASRSADLSQMSLRACGAQRRFTPPPLYSASGSSRARVATSATLPGCPAMSDVAEPATVAVQTEAATLVRPGSSTAAVQRPRAGRVTSRRRVAACRVPKTDRTSRRQRGAHRPDAPADLRTAAVRPAASWQSRGPAGRVTARSRPEFGMSWMVAISVVWRQMTSGGDS